MRVIKGDDVRGTLVLEELPVHPRHLRGADEVEAKFSSGDVHLLREDMAEDAAEEGEAEAAVALAVAELERKT